MKNKLIVPGIIVIGLSIYLINSALYPGQIRDLLKGTQDNFTVAYVKDDFCVTCPDGTFVFDLSQQKANVILVDQSWSSTDIDNLARTLKPECSIVVSSKETASFLLREGERSGGVFFMQFEIE